MNDQEEYEEVEYPLLMVIMAHILGFAAYTSTIVLLIYFLIFLPRKIWVESYPELSKSEYSEIEQNMMIVCDTGRLSSKQIKNVIETVKVCGTKELKSDIYHNWNIPNTIILSGITKDEMWDQHEIKCVSYKKFRRWNRFFHEYEVFTYLKIFFRV